jgi:hypothetical protein
MPQPTRRPGTPAPTAAVVPLTLTPDEITAKLRELGMVETGSTGDFNRVKMDGGTFIMGDEMYVSNPVTKAPAFRARIMELPIEYQAYWFTAEDAAIVGRDGSVPDVPSIADRFCKSYFEDPQQAREYAEDGTACRQCPVNPFTKNSPTGKKCSWKGDISFQVLDKDGMLPEDAPIWTVTLPTTAMMEFKGTSRAPLAGHVGELNFMQLLARLALENAPDGNAALYRAWTAARNGGVIADFRAVPTQSQDGARRYNVIQLTPVAILDVEEPAAVGDGNGGGDASGDIDDLPF